MSEINQIYVGENKEFFTIADTAARNQIANLDRVVVTPLPSHPQIATGDTIDTAFSKTEAQFEALGDMAFKDNLTKSDVTSALDYDPQKEDEDIKKNFQDSVETICTHIEAKESPVAEPHSLEHVCDAIDAITTAGNYDTLEVREDGEYDPPAGIDAWNHVIVSKDVGQPHTVVFYGPEGNVIKTQTNVPYHGFATCTHLDGTIYQGQNFMGQNPPASDIVRDTYCYPIYGDYIIDPGEIDETWEEICADGGAHVPIGGYRNLILNVTAQPDEVLAVAKRYSRDYGQYTPYDTEFKVQNADSIVFQYPYFMVKVAEGEDGSTSTWLSTGCATIPSITYTYHNDINDETLETANLLYYTAGLTSYRADGHFDDQSSCVLRQILNGKVLSCMEPALQRNIKQVTKYTRGLTQQTPDGTRVEIQTLDKIWVPSVKELDTVMSVARIGGVIVPQSYSDIAEVHGIDYASQYDPIQPDNIKSGGWQLRTMGYGGNDSTQASICQNDQGSGPERVINNYSNLPRYGYTRVPFGFCL